MGHYDDYYEADRQERALSQRRTLIREVQEGRYQPLLDASRLCDLQVVTVPLSVFESMMTILSSLDLETYR